MNQSEQKKKKIYRLMFSCQWCDDDNLIEGQKLCSTLKRMDFQPFTIKSNQSDGIWRQKKDIFRRFFFSKQ